MNIRIITAVGLLVRSAAAQSATTLPVAKAPAPKAAVSVVAAPPAAAAPTTPAAEPPVAAPPVATATPVAPAATAPGAPLAVAATPPASTAPTVAPPVAAPLPVPAEKIVLAETPSAPPSADVTPPPRNDGEVRSHFNIGFDLDNVWYTGKSYDLFSTNNLGASLGVNLGYALWVDSRLSVVPELGFGIDDESTSNLFGGAISHTELKTVRYYGGASVRYAVLPFLEPEIRAAVGASHADVTVNPGEGPSSLTQNATSPFASIGAGFTLQTPSEALTTRGKALRSLVIGFNVEGGYIGGTSIDLAPTSSQSAGRIATSDAHLGTLSRSGPYVRTAIQLRF